MFRQLTISELDGILERIFNKIRSEKMSESTTPGDKHFTVECAEYLQTLIVEELNLINSRMSWLLISETFLIASYATLINDFEPQYYEVINVFFVILPIIGMLLSLVALISILSAGAVLVYLGCKEGQIMEEVNAIYEYEIAEVAGNWDDRVENLKWTIICGGLPHWLIPLFIIGFWSFLLLYAPQCEVIEQTNWFHYTKALENQFSCSSSLLSNELYLKIIAIGFLNIPGFLILILYWCKTCKIKEDFYQKAIKVNSCILLTHLLKWKYLHSKRSKIWKNSIKKYRKKIEKSFQDRPELKEYFKNNFKDFYKEARKKAAEQTDLSLESFPEKCPFTRKQVLEVNYLPYLIF